MSFDTERQNIEARLKANWTTTPIAYPNVPFEKPDNSAWVRLNIINGASNYHTMSNGIRRAGVIVVQIFTPINTGTKTIKGYADTILGIFQNAEFGGIVCNVASIETAAPSNVWQQVNVSIPFWRDE